MIQELLDSENYKLKHPLNKYFFIENVNHLMYAIQRDRILEIPYPTKIRSIYKNRIKNLVSDIISNLEEIRDLSYEHLEICNPSQKDYLSYNVKKDIAEKVDNIYADSDNENYIDGYNDAARDVLEILGYKLHVNKNQQLEVIPE